MLRQITSVQVCILSDRVIDPIRFITNPPSLSGLFFYPEPVTATSINGYAISALICCLSYHVQFHWCPPGGSLNCDGWYHLIPVVLVFVLHFDFRALWSGFGAYQVHSQLPLLTVLDAYFTPCRMCLDISASIRNRYHDIFPKEHLLRGLIVDSLSFIMTVIPLAHRPFPWWILSYIVSAALYGGLLPPHTWIGVGHQDGLIEFHYINCVC